MKKLAYGFVLAFAAMSAAVAFAAGELPSGYTEVEYIQGPGNGRIVTDYTPQPETDKIEAVVEWPANTLNASQAIWCSRGNGTQADSWTLFYINDNKKFRYDYMPTGHPVSLVPDFTAATGTKYTITAEDNTVTYSANGSVLQTQSTPVYSYTAGSVLALFASHYSGINANLNYYGKHKLYSFKVWRSGDLIHYFVPCKDANNAATMVDICDNPATLTKSGTFTAGQEGHYYDDSVFGPLKIILSTDTIKYNPLSTVCPEVTVSNINTGAILSEGSDYEVTYSNATHVGTATVYVTGCGTYDGEKVKAKYKIVSDRYLPPGYRQIASITSTGTQYIKTGMLPTATTTVEFDFNSGATANDTTFFGQGYSQNNYLFIRQSDKFKFYGGGTVIGDWHANTDIHLSVTSNNTTILNWGDGTATTTTVSRTSHASNAFNIFADSGGSHKGSWTFYAMKIYSNNGATVVRDYVPAERESDSEIGLYDRANNVFYANQGTGAFIPGKYVDVVLDIADIPPAVADSGAPATPPLTVTSTITGETLSEGTDYEVVYSNNTARGTATAYVCGLGTYAGITNSAKFTVYLPVAAGMTKLEYVEFTGAQHVNTGLLPIDHQLEFEFQTVTYANNNILFGTQNNGNYYTLYEVNSYYVWGYNGSTGTTSGKLGVDTTKRRRMVFNRIGDNAILIDGTEYATGTAPYSKANLYIARRENSNNWKGRVFFVRATNRATGKVELELVPAKNADGVAGFYDRVSGRFLTPLSTSSSAVTPLVAGPEMKPSDFSVSPIPVQHDWSAGASRPSTGAAPTLVVSNLVAGTLLTEGVDYSVSYVNNVSNGIAKAVLTGLGTYAGKRDIVCFRVYNSIFEEYRPLEYIESTNTAAWIGSDYIHTTSTRVEMVSYVPKAKLGLNGYQYHALFGGRRNSAGQESFIFFVRYANNNKPVWTRNADTQGANGAYPYDEWVALNCGSNNGLTASWEGLETGNSGSLTSSANVKGSVPLAIFGINAYNGYGHNYSLTDRTVMKLKSFKVYENDKLVHDYIPCRRLSDGAIGLYEPYWNQFYVNRGTSDLLAGRDVAKLQIAYEIPDQPQVGYAAVTPAVVVTDYTTGETLTEGVDYTVSYIDNTAPGTGRVVLTGIGDYVGEIGGRDFKIYDGGPATPYPNLSRSYVPGGLVGFWDGIDNAGTGTHDPAAATWVDLSGHGFDGTMNGIATWKDGNAMHNEANGQPCTLPLAFSAAVDLSNNWINNTTFEFGFRPSELSAVRAIFSNYAGTSSYGTIIAHNGSSFTDGGLRFYSRNTSNNNSCDQKIASVVKADEFARFAIISESYNLLAYRDDDFANAVHSSSVWCNKSATTAYVIGGQPSDNAMAMRGDIYFVRVYNRVLDREEMEFNRALDRIRYDNKSLRFTLPEKLPDGYAYDAARDALRVRITANAIPAKGLVSINGGAAAKYASEFVDVGSTVTLTYSGDGFVAWTNIASVCAYPSGAASGVVTFTAGAPVAAMVDAAADDGSISTLTAYSYVQKGLIRLWDGIDNAGTGVHAATNRWVDLAGSGAEWVVRHSGTFGNNCLTLVASQDSAGLRSYLPSYETAEFCFNLSSGQNLFSNADDYSRIFLVNCTYGTILAERYNNFRGAPTGYSPFTVYNRPNTCAVTYHDIRGLFFDVKYYQNGQRLQPGCAISSNQATGSYPALGSKYDANESQCAGSLYSVRMYDRPLAEDELRFNAALDRVRYLGANAAAMFANMTLPDGYRWNSSAGRLEVRVDIETRRGTSSVASGTWFAVGEDVAVNFTPSAANRPVEWKGRPLGSTVTEENGVSTLYWKAAAPASILVSGDIVLPALSYVSKGLIGLWDAKENVAPGVHDVLAEQWYDLTGHQQEPWTLIRGRAAFLDDAVQAGGYFNATHPIVQYSLLPDWKTVEAHIAPMMTNGTKLVLSERLANRFLYIGMLPGANFFGGYKSATAECATDPEIAVPYVANTYSLAYEGDAATPSAYYIGGRPVTEKKTASCDWSIDNDYPTLGSRYNQTSGKMLARYYVLRMYDRDLTATEVAFNAAVDKVRYGGARFADVVPASLPDGYRYDSATDTLEVRISVFAAEGAASINGGDTNVWVEVGKPVEIAYTPVAGRGVRDWAGLPGDARLADEAQTARFTAAAPVEAAIKTAATSSALPASMYVADGLIASWDALDADGTTEGWVSSAPLERRANAAVFDGTAYMYNSVAGIKQALIDKSLTVQMFLRPKRFIWNGGYLHIGTGKDVRDLVLSMQGDKNSNMKSQRGAFGALQCAATTALNADYSGIRKETTEYFGEDTLVSIVRDAEGGKVGFNGEGFCLTNSYNNNAPSTDLVNIGSWLGARNATFDLYAVRIYNRVLTQAELEYNGSVDRARFCGEAIDLPEGYTNDEGVVKAFIAVTVPGGNGQVSINGSTPAASASAWLPVGSTANVTFTPTSGYAIDGWTGLPSSASYFDGGNTASFKVGGPLAIGVSALELAYSDDNFTSTADIPSPIALGNNTVYAFPAGSHTLVAKNDFTIMQAFVVGGGGAGGANCGGGGGGGGTMLVERPVFVPAGATLEVIVGAGGAVAATAGGAGGQGGASSLVAGDLEVTVPGGGGGGGWSSTAPTSGGNIASGGGRANKNVAAFIDGWDYDSNYGYPGGISVNNDSYKYYGPGGGGATSAGESSLGSATARKGGAGIMCPINGTVTVYGSGGGGGGTLGGAGGTNGGAGGTNANDGEPGVDGTGSGGGGGGKGDAYYGGKGGDGVVIFSFALGDKRAVALDVQVQEQVPYLGVPAVPEVVVTVGGVPQVKDVDFRVDCSGNTAPGIGIATISGLAGSAMEGISVPKSFIITQVIYADETAAGNADGTSWANAKAPQGALDAAATVFAGGIVPEVWFKSGTYLPTAPVTVTTPCTIRGGFLGDDSDPAALDPVNPETLFDGQGTGTKPSSVNQAFSVTAADITGKVIFERCSFCRFRLHGFQKSGKTSIVVRKCRSFNNGWGIATGAGSYELGLGMHIVGSADTTAEFEDCEFFGDGQVGQTNIDAGKGFAAFIRTFKRVYFDNCTFTTNGWGANHRSAAGSAIYATSAPITARNTRFIGNGLAHADGGATVYLTGASEGSAFTNCLFLGNFNRWYGYFGGGGKSGALHVEFSDRAGLIEVDHCTFAYNLSGAFTGSQDKNTFDYGSAAALDVWRGTAKVRNSIFWGNAISSENMAGADIYLYQGDADVDYSLFGGLVQDYIATHAGSTLKLGEHIILGDPGFETRPETVKNATSQRDNFFIPRTKSSAGNLAYSSRELASSFSAKIVSGAGNYSPAIDGSELSYPVGDEPLPNGGIANLGYYGTTPEAALSIEGAPAIAGGTVSVDFPNGETLAVATFTLGGDPDYNARATVYFGTGAAAAAGTAYDWSHDYAGLQNGDTVTSRCPIPFTDGDTLYVKVVISAPGQADVVYTTSTTVTGDTPAWVGHGGDPDKVVHVRAGSVAVDPHGTSWADAYPDIDSANLAMTETRNEMWVCGDIVRTAYPGHFSLAAPGTLRGGFTGTEDSLDDRPDGTYSALDGNCTFNAFRLDNMAKLTIERMSFMNGYGYGIVRLDCHGDLTVVDCKFLNNGTADNTALSGCAIRFYRKVHNKANLEVIRCRFEGNGRRFEGNAQLDGACIYANDANSVLVEDSVFLTNGAPFSLSSSSTSAAPRPAGSCIYMSGTPVTVTGCRFAGNRSSAANIQNAATYGGVIYLGGTCNNSVIRNCAFVGNECVTRTSTASQGGTLGGTLVVNLGEAIREVFVENCTFAWNFSFGGTIPVDVCANVGVVHLHNSIFYGGISGRAQDSGIGKYANAAASGTIDANYTMFDCPLAAAVGGTGVKTVDATCMVGDPNFVTQSPAFEVRDADTVQSALAGGMEEIATACDVHLVSLAGYVDNDGVFHDGGSAYSPAIDMGDPADDYSLEPAPNGGFVNLGAYGNTPEASRTYTVQPEIVNNDIVITFPNNTSFPKVEFNLAAAQVDYTAVVKVYFGTNGFDFASFESPALPLRGGEHFAYLEDMEPYLNGDTLYVRVVVTSGEHELVVDRTATVTGQMPPWWGKGGGPGVVHVWANAPGDNDGTSWRNAYRNVEEAFAAIDNSTIQIWICGDYRLETAALAVTPSRALTIRGGFTATENDPSERPAGTRSRIDANNSFNVFNVSNGSGIPVVIDGIEAYNGISSGIYKTGAGDFTLANCSVLTNGQHGADGSRYDGKGMRVDGAAGANIVVTNSIFQGNMLQVAVYDNTTSQGNGCALYIGSGTSATIVDTVFCGNGYPNITPYTDHSGNALSSPFDGGTVLTQIPTVFRGCRFAGNRTVNGLYGGIPWGGILALRGGAGGSRIENCAFVANQDTPNSSHTPQTDVNGAVSVKLDDKAGTVDIVNCTFAYNLVETTYGAAGVTVVKGTANVKNSIFTGNILGLNCTTHGVDLSVLSNGVCNVSYTMFSVPDAAREGDTAMVCAEGGVLNLGAGVIYGDPLLVTEFASITNLIRNYNAGHILFNPSLNPDATMQSVNAHLKGKAGWYDENTGEYFFTNGRSSPAIDAGDPASDWSKEPNRAGEGFPGRRVNLGRYGNTPWATMTPHPGNVFILR